MGNEEKNENARMAIGGGIAGAMGLGAAVLGNPFLAGGRLVDIQSIDLMDKAILVGEGSKATRCEAVVRVIGSTVMSRLDINFSENVTLSDDMPENTNNMNEVVFLFNEFNKAYFKAIKIQKENFLKVKAYQEGREAGHKAASLDIVKELVAEMGLPKIKELIAMLNKRVDASPGARLIAEIKELAKDPSDWSMTISTYHALVHCFGKDGGEDVYQLAHDAIRHLRCEIAAEDGSDLAQFSLELSSNPIYLIQAERAVAHHNGDVDFPLSEKLVEMFLKSKSDYTIVKNAVEVIDSGENSEDEDAMDAVKEFELDTILLIGAKAALASYHNFTTCSEEEPNQPEKDVTGILVGTPDQMVNKYKGLLDYGNKFGLEPDRARGACKQCSSLFPELEGAQPYKCGVKGTCPALAESKDECLELMKAKR